MGSEHAHTLLTASTDGRLCAWDADKLTAPVETSDLKEMKDPKDATGKQPKPVAVTAMAFMSAASGDTNNYLVGSEEGMLYQASRHGSKAGIGAPFAAADGAHSHFGPITVLGWG